MISRIRAFTGASGRGASGRLSPAGVGAKAGVLLLALLTIASPAAGEEAVAGDIAIRDAWSRAVPQGAKVAAGYMTIRNEGAEPDTLLSIVSGVATSAEIHEMAVDDRGVMTMRPLSEGLEIPAGDSVELKPGSFHLMFVDLEHPLVEGETFLALLTFENAGAIQVEFKIRPMGGRSHGHGHDAGSHHGD
jgi:periplasmic copper chaperone A